MTASREVDVIVIGGGPAGLATAIALAQRDWSVTILERSHYESTRIGETLPPEIKQPLFALGTWGRFLADGPIESPGITAAWLNSKVTGLCMTGSSVSQRLPVRTDIPATAEPSLKPSRTAGGIARRSPMVARSARS